MLTTNPTSIISKSVKMACMVEAEVYDMVKGTVPLSSTLHPSLTGEGRSPEQGQDRAG